MVSTAEKRALKNTYVGILSFILTFLQSILIVPIILNSWGAVKYGNWITLFAAFTLLQSVDLGHQNYIGNEVNVLYHKNRNDLKKTLSSSLLMAFIIGFLEVLLTVYIILSGSATSILGLDTSQTELAISLLILMMMWFSIGSITGILMRLLIPIGKLYEQQWISLIIRLIQFFALLTVVLIKGSILSAAIAYSIVQLVLSFIALLKIKQYVPEFYPWWQNANFITGLKNFGKSIVLTVNSIVQQLSLSGLILFVSNFYQIILVPVYSTIRTLTNTAGMVTNIMSTAVFPETIKYYAKGEDKKLYFSLTINLFLSGLIVNTAIVLSIFFIEPLFLIWTRGHLTFDKNLFLFLASGISFANFGTGIINYFFGVNKLRQYTIIVVSKSLVLFITAYLLIGKSELSTIGISVAISELISSVLLPIYFIKQDNKSFFKGDGAKFFGLSLIPPLLIMCLAFLNYFNVLTYAIVLTIFVIIILVYFLSWKLVDEEVKIRMRNINIKKYFFRNGA